MPQEYTHNNVTYKVGEYITANAEPIPNITSDNVPGGSGFEPHKVLLIDRITTNTVDDTPFAVFWAKTGSGIYNGNFRHSTVAEINQWKKVGKSVVVEPSKIGVELDVVDTEEVEMVIPKKPKIRY